MTTSANRQAYLSRRFLLKAGASAISLLSAVVPSVSAMAEDQQPKHGGTMVSVIPSDPTSSNPTTTTNSSDTEVAGFIYEGLTRIAPDFSIEPNLAKSWTVSSDGLNYTFQLVAANWHDGKPFTASDVKFTLEEVSAKYSARFAEAAKRIKSVTVVGDSEFSIALSESFGPFLFALSTYGGGAVFPKHVFEGTNVLENPALFDKPIGTGPFRMKEWIRGDRVILEKNPDYWVPDRPYLDSVVLRVISDPNTVALAMLAGEADYCNFYYFPASRIGEVKSVPTLQVKQQGIPSDALLIFNTRNAALKDAKVRQALMYATDRAYIRNIVFHDIGDTMQNHIDSRIGWASDRDVNLDTLYKHDPARAKSLLDEAGLKANSNGERFQVRLSFDSGNLDWSRLGQVLQEMWAEVGVKVVLDGNPRNTMLEKVFKNLEFDATLQNYSTAGDPALGVSRLYVSSAIKPQPFLNVSGYSNPTIDELFAQGAAGSAPAERGAIYKKIPPILAQDLPTIPLLEVPANNVASAKLKGSWAYSTGTSHWEDVWLDS